MSLVGSLEDLGLPDILQIIGLSRKSGLLRLLSDEGEGRILVRDGLVCGAVLRGEPEDLRALLAGAGCVDPVLLDTSADLARRAERPLEEVVLERSGLLRERIDALRREQIERAVRRMFDWRLGEFRFEVGGEADAASGELALAAGLNPQYLAIEAARLWDEPAGAAPAPAPAVPKGASESEILFSGEGEAREGSRPRGRAAPAEQPAARAAPRPRLLVAVDPELPALEWLKGVLAEHFERIHIFQDAESGLARIRHYLARGELPVVLLAPEIESDGRVGLGQPPSLARRLRALAPQLPIFVVRDTAAPGEGASPDVDAELIRPPAGELARPGARERLAEAGEELLRVLRSVGERGAPAAAPGPGADRLVEQLRQLKRASEGVRDASATGEVLALLLDFAAEHFSRVAVFVPREERAVGLSQRGLAAGGGPLDAELRKLEIPIAGCAWFREAVAGREPVRAAPRGEGDVGLARALGAVAPREAWVGALESGGAVAALLYGDMLPGDAPIGDTTTLEILLCHAGLALDRALLERALAAAGGG